MAQQKEPTMFRLQWIDGSEIVSSWNDVENHPKFLTAEVSKRMPFGWLVV
jgi:hypothetical protein